VGIRGDELSSPLMRLSQANLSRRGGQTAPCVPTGVASTGRCVTLGHSWEMTIHTRGVSA
jgi:hypothetical protein